MSERITLATASGLPLAVLAFHVTMGMVALLAGGVAVAARKGAAAHRWSGLVFMGSMIAMGLAATVVSLIAGKETFTGGITTSYLVFTAWTTLDPTRTRRRDDVALMILAFSLAALGYFGGVTALGRPGNQIEGVPAGMIFFMATITLLAAVGDARMIRAGGIEGPRRLARHLWRMCFALFIATGSFFLGQMRFVPEPVRWLPLMFALGIAPLFLLLYWMWRVRWRRNLRGLVTAKAPGDSSYRGTYRVATAPDASSTRSTGRRSMGLESPANSVGP